MNAVDLAIATKENHLQATTATGCLQRPQTRRMTNVAMHSNDRRRACLFFAPPLLVPILAFAQESPIHPLRRQARSGITRLPTPSVERNQLLSIDDVMQPNPKPTLVAIAQSRRQLAFQESYTLQPWPAGAYRAQFSLLGPSGFSGRHFRKLSLPCAWLHGATALLA